ncbi:DUF262 domain-containing protein [Bradyrhizobium diazoefficiens]|uniref:DUF262 domain-containing protein n=1 Tax=Bradyrhizobium diazoefficiens TaxID=1355477 RepID=UPI000BE7AD8E|nr:DUF262 domain-containing protein [Bradyrhizobium diazoefficiens]PDT61824.1 hypothetical protein CO678_12890 [Bradyrhizobium diazoefficiens]QLD43496.1 DUF262 domain-containing protein [Bradyrhizobium diazoefficiens]
MTLQIKPSVTNPTVADVYQEIDQGKLVLQPDFQRKFVWTHEHQEDFIDTILAGLPFPEIYVCEGEVDVQRLRTTRLVIDGQQRLTTIRNYIEGKHEHPLAKVPPYKDLTDGQKREFASYQIVMRDLGKVDHDTTREIFRRINLTKFKLDDVEIHNAVYDGHFIQAAKYILENVNLEQYGVLRESEFTRMADLHFILLVMATIENGGYFAQDREVEPKVSAFNDEYPNRDHTIALLIKTFAIIRDLNLPVDSMWFRKSNFFTLVVEIANHIGGLPNDLSQKLLALEEKVMANRSDTNSEFYRYYSYMYQATHGRQARVVRAEFFQKYCL